MQERRLSVIRDFHVVRKCRQAGIRVVPLPWFTVAITALCASGIASIVFVPKRVTKVKLRRDKLTELADEAYLNFL